MKIYAIYSLSPFTGKEELSHRVLLEENMIDDFTRTFYQVYQRTYCYMKETDLTLEHPLVVGGIIKVRKPYWKPIKQNFSDTLYS